jgi:hypothetical protein
VNEVCVLSDGRGATPIDRNKRPGNVLGTTAQKPCDRLGDILGCAQGSNFLRGAGGRVLLCRKKRAFGLDRTRQDRVCTDIVVAEAIGDAFGEQIHRRIRATTRQVCAARLAAAAPGDIYDATATVLLHKRNDSPHRTHVRRQVASSTG